MPLGGSFGGQQIGNSELARDIRNSQGEELTSQAQEEYHAFKKYKVKGGAIDAFVDKDNNLVALVDPATNHRVFAAHDLACCRARRARRDCVPCPGLDTADQGNKPNMNREPEPPTAKEPKVSAEAKELEFTTAAERASEKEFGELAATHKLTAVAEGKWELSLSAVRARLLGYKPLGPGSPKILSPGGANLPFKIQGLVDAFSTNANALDRAVATASIIPIVGCAVQLGAYAQDGQVTALEGVDLALCFLGDALLLGKVTAPLGIAVHVVRSMISAFVSPPDRPTRAELKSLRDKPWQAFLDEKLTRFLSSKAFRTKLESSVAIDSLAVLSEAGQAIGLLNAASQLDATNLADVPVELSQIQADTQKAIDGIRSTASTEIVRRQRQFLLTRPSALRDDMSVSLESTASDYNSEFIKRITSDEMIEAYPDSSIIGEIADNFDAPVGRSRFAQSRRFFNEEGQYLRGQSATTP
ncbi:hypothetical protein HIM_10525 [Hirsutella minnesotensis 3608]|uniref:Uncharacterized protein n=1 Tax=Hirsutella minnesotensis 3608 TaxID=1043627 RepID=A0A0F7ZJZ3_9HYPO|nr:hypothetical protein HIM_10525 [Hirsutella minnesotensis 3608]